MNDPRPIALVGLRGSGKSTVGSALATALGWPFVDLDLVLAERAAGLGAVPAGSGPGRCLVLLGTARFRELEREVLRECLVRPGPRVVATGGGAVEDEGSRALLRERALCLWLDPALDELRARLARDPGDRPPLLGGEVRDELAELDRRRRPLYRDVAAVRLTEAGPPERVVAEVLGQMGRTSAPD
jgi:shikimate kinase